jgi:lipopolysaccharide transport protein LptA
MLKIVLFAIITSILTICTNSFANNTKSEDITPTNIKSDTIIVTKDKNIIEFEYNVVLTKDDISLLSDKMLVLIEEKKINQNNGKNSKREIKSAKAIGNVKMFGEEFFATGDFGDYDVKNSLFKITGNVILNEGTKIANGDEFTYDLIKKSGFLSSKNSKDGDKSDKSSRPMVIINEDIDNFKQNNETSDN